MHERRHSDAANAPNAARKLPMRHSLLFLFLLTSTPAMSQNQDMHTPAPGSAEREAILDAARAPLQQTLDQKVEFVVRQMRVDDDWGFVYAQMQHPGGGAIDYAATSYAEAAKEGGVSQDYAALLHRHDGHWTVRTEVVGPTDPAWLAWPEEYKVPEALFAD